MCRARQVRCVMDQAMVAILHDSSWHGAAPAVQSSYSAVGRDPTRPLAARVALAGQKGTRAPVWAQDGHGGCGGCVCAPRIGSAPREDGRRVSREMGNEQANLAKRGHVYPWPEEGARAEDAALRASARHKAARSRMACSTMRGMSRICFKVDVPRSAVSMRIGQRYPSRYGDTF